MPIDSLPEYPEPRESDDDFQRVGADGALDDDEYEALYEAWERQRFQSAVRREPYLKPTSLIFGWPGYRLRDGKSGLGYVESEAELAHMEGVFLRNLFTLRLRTRNWAYLLLMLVFAGFGLLPALGFVLAWMAQMSSRTARSAAAIDWIVMGFWALAIGIPAFFLLVNLLASLLAPPETND